MPNIDEVILSLPKTSLWEPSSVASDHMRTVLDTDMLLKIIRLKLKNKLSTLLETKTNAEIASILNDQPDLVAGVPYLRNMWTPDMVQEVRDYVPG